MPNSGESTHKGWVLITGASAGIGEVFAKRFAAQGYNTVLVARSLERLEALAKSLRDEFGTKSLVISADLSSTTAPRMVFQKTQDAGIEVEGLVNNAGFGGGGKFGDAAIDLYLSMIDVNVRALVALTGLFLPGLKERKRGFVLNVSSTASFQPLPRGATYAATKAFVTSFTEALWLEMKGTGVRILNLCPGVTKTNFGNTAGMHDFHKDPHAETPEAVVETALRALRKRQPTVISGFGNRLLMWIERLLPHCLVLFLVNQYQNSKGRV